MARIRIIDEWMRSPVAPPQRQRTVMVVAETWAEQKVLMRAFHSSLDQTAPTIALRGAELAIGPAGIEPYGPWGIHVPPGDGAAQALRGQLEEAARRVAGSKGNPPRLLDEVSAYERRGTDVWAGRAVDSPRARRARQTRQVFSTSRSAAAPATSPPPEPAAPPPARTAFGFALGATPLGSARSYHHAPRGSLATAVGRTLPVGIQLDAAERCVLDALSRTEALTSAQVGALAQVSDGVAFMTRFIAKLGGHGLDLIEAAPSGYRLRR